MSTNLGIGRIPQSELHRVISATTRLLLFTEIRIAGLLRRHDGPEGLPITFNFRVSISDSFMTALPPKLSCFKNAEFSLLPLVLLKYTFRQYP